MAYQMKNGKWRGKRMIGGKVKTKVFSTKAEAKRWEATQSAEAWQEQVETPTVSWLDFATAYLDYAKERFSRQTFNEKKVAFKRSMAIIDAKSPTDAITLKQTTAVMRKVGRESSGHTANKTRKNLAAAWEWGIKFYGLPNANPFHDAEKLPADATPRYVPPESDFWKVYDTCDDPRDKTLLLFLLHTGARIQEAFRLVWSDIDFERQQVRLGTRKTATGGMEYAWIPMTTELREALLKHKDQSRTMNVFVAQRTGNVLTHRQHFMHRACKAAGVTPFGYHAIRHLTATILAHAGLDLPSIQAILRHHNPTTTARYIKSLGVQANKIDAVFSQKKRGAEVTNFNASELEDQIGTRFGTRR